MKKFLIIILAAIALPNSVNANWFNKKDFTLKDIEVKCKSADSKYFEYKEIGMNQFAKNYLKICMETEVNRVLKEKYERCLKKDNKENCQTRIKNWIKESLP